MPLTLKRRDDESAEQSAASEERTYTTFVHKARWFVVSQTYGSGSELGPITIPEWDADRALAALCIERIPFDKTDGNVQGFARARQLAINPVAQLPHKTLFHEVAHVLLHTSEGDFTDTEQTPRNLREVEAESVALLCCEALGLEGADYARGYIQNWLYEGIGYNAAATPCGSVSIRFHRGDPSHDAATHEYDAHISFNPLSSRRSVSLSEGGRGVGVSQRFNPLSSRRSVSQGRGGQATILERVSIRFHRGDPSHSTVYACLSALN